MLVRRHVIPTRLNYDENPPLFFPRTGIADWAYEIVDSLREGCVPLNPFGLAASPDAIAYAWGDLVEFTDTTNTMASITFSGAFWHALPAGPARMAGGIDYRDNTIDNIAGGDPDPVRRQDFSVQYGDSWTGGTEVADVFAELEFPLLRGKPGAEYMMINVSNRRSRNETFREDIEDRQESVRYSDSRKVSWVYSPTRWMRVRTTRSQDIRQPSSRELFYRQTMRGGGFGGFGTTPNPWRTVNQDGDTWDTIIGANPNLRNEESITETLGLVFTPGGWARGIEFSVDYYKVMVKGGISYQFGSDPENEDNLPYTIFRCFQYEDPFYCGLIEFGTPSDDEPDNPRSNIESVTNTVENAEPYWSRGVDISAMYSKRLNGGGSFNVRLMATRNIEQSICTNQVRISEGESRCDARQNVVGQTGGFFAGGLLANYSPTPSWSGNLFGTYRRNAWSVTAQARFTGSGQGSVLWVGPDDPKWAPDSHFTISNNTMPSWTTWNTTFNYNFGQSRLAPQMFTDLSVSLNIDNLFDKQPNFWSGGNTGGVNTRFFNGMGRTYRLGLRMGF